MQYWENEENDGDINLEQAIIKKKPITSYI